MCFLSISFRFRERKENNAEKCPSDIFLGYETKLERKEKKIKLF